MTIHTRTLLIMTIYIRTLLIMTITIKTLLIMRILIALNMGEMTYNDITYI